MYVLKELQPTLFNSNVYVNDYFLLIRPPKQVNEDVKKFKQELAPRMGSLDATHSPAYISLLRFTCIAEQEYNLLRQLELWGHQQSRIQIRLSQFNHFDYSRTLLIDIANKESVLQLHHQLWWHLKLNMKGIDLAKLNFDPYLTIEKKLPSHQFPLVSKEFSGKPYRKKFFCNQLTLLKRSYDYRNEREYWMKAREIPLLGQTPEEKTKEYIMVENGIINNPSNKLPAGAALW